MTSLAAHYRKRLDLCFLALPKIAAEVAVEMGIRREHDTLVFISREQAGLFYKRVKERETATC